LRTLPARLTLNKRQSRRKPDATSAQPTSITGEMLEAAMARPAAARGAAACVALALPFVAILWIPLYARTEPRLAGLPFFYWYQFVWIVLSAALMAVSYRLLRTPKQEKPDE